MSIAKDFNNVMHREINVLAAWLPVTNLFKVGDFGVISDGVFTRMGSIESDFGVSFETQAGPPVMLDFKSEDVREFRLGAGADIGTVAGKSVEAKLRIEFGRERSFFLKAQLVVEQMKSPFSVAGALAQKSRWNEGKFKVVSGAYSGEGCVILSSKQRNTTVEIGGSADALEQLDLGNAQASLLYTSSSELGLEVIGEAGVVGLELFKVKKREGLPEFESVDPMEAIEVSKSEDWGADLEDDI